MRKLFARWFVAGVAAFTIIVELIAPFGLPLLRESPPDWVRVCLGTLIILQAWHENKHHPHSS